MSVSVRYFALCGSFGILAQLVHVCLRANLQVVLRTPSLRILARFMIWDICMTLPTLTQLPQKKSINLLKLHASQCLTMAQVLLLRWRTAYNAYAVRVSAFPRDPPEISRSHMYQRTGKSMFFLHNQLLRLK